MSRLIKSRISNSTPSEKKIISIKMLNFPEQTGNTHALEDDGHSSFELIEEARLEAEQIRGQAKLEIEALYADIQQERATWEQEKTIIATEAQERGYQAGWDEGQQHGYSEYQDRLKEAQHIIQAAKSDYTSYLEASEKTILDLATKIAEKIIGTKIEESGDFFLSLVKKVLKDVKESQDVQIHVHPNRYENILARKEELLSVFSHETNLFIYPDDDLLEDSCLIESANGRIDASIDVQLSEIKHKLTELLESELQ